MNNPKLVLGFHTRDFSYSYGKESAKIKLIAEVIGITDELMINRATRLEQDCIKRINSKLKCEGIVSLNHFHSKMISMLQEGCKVS